MWLKSSSHVSVHHCKKCSSLYVTYGRERTECTSKGHSVLAAVNVWKVMVFFLVCVCTRVNKNDTAEGFNLLALYYLAELRMSHLNQHYNNAYNASYRTCPVFSCHPNFILQGIRGTARSHASYVTLYMSMYQKTRTVLLANCWNLSLTNSLSL